MELRADEAISSQWCVPINLFSTWFQNVYVLFVHLFFTSLNRLSFRWAQVKHLSLSLRAHIGLLLTSQHVRDGSGSPLLLWRCRVARPSHVGLDRSVSAGLFIRDEWRPGSSRANSAYPARWRTTGKQMRKCRLKYCICVTSYLFSLSWRNYNIFQLK